MKTFSGQLFLTVREVAAAFCVSRRTILSWCFTDGRRPKKAPDLQPLRGPNDRLYFRKSHVDALLESYFGEKRASEPNSSGTLSSETKTEGILQGT